MKLWIDDVRPALSKEYMSCKSVNMAKGIIQYWEKLANVTVHRKK